MSLKTLRVICILFSTIASCSPVAPEMTVVPSVVDMLLGDAYTVLNEARIKVGFVVNTTDQVDNLIVINQSIDPGSIVEINTSINLRVSVS